jgi:hypothetical protein
MVGVKRFTPYTDFGGARAAASCPDSGIARLRRDDFTLRVHFSPPTGIGAARRPPVARR